MKRVGVEEGRSKFWRGARRGRFPIEPWGLGDRQQGDLGAGRLGGKMWAPIVANCRSCLAIEVEIVGPQSFPANGRAESGSSPTLMPRRRGCRQAACKVVQRVPETFVLRNLKSSTAPRKQRRRFSRIAGSLSCPSSPQETSTFKFGRIQNWLRFFPDIEILPATYFGTHTANGSITQLYFPPASRQNHPTKTS